jgi:hypothetical protein
VIRDQRHTKTPRWWSVAPPTPAEAPQAKRRTAARSRGSIVLVVAIVGAFVVSVLLLFFRVGRQVRGVEPVVASLVGSVPVSPVHPSVADGGARAVPIAGDDAAPAGVPEAGAAGARSRPAREVFRKPGF